MNLKPFYLWAIAGFSVVAVSAAQADQAPTANPTEESYSGTVVAIDSQTHTLTAKSGLFNKQFHLGDNCSFVLPDNASGSLSNLRTGEKVQINYQDAQGVLVSDRVEIVPLRYEGTIRSIDPVNHTLTVRENGVDRNLAIANGCRVMLRANQAGTLNTIQPGDRVTVDYETPGDQSTAWQIARTSDSITGFLVAFDLTDRTIKVKDGYVTLRFSLADDCAIVMNGQPAGRLGDLRPEERVVLTYNAANGVNVVNRIVPAAAFPANPSMTGGPGMVTGLHFQN